MGLPRPSKSQTGLSRPSLPPADPQAAARAAFMGAADAADSSDEEGDSTSRGVPPGGAGGLQPLGSFASQASGVQGQPRFKVASCCMLCMLPVSFSTRSGWILRPC